MTVKSIQSSDLESLARRVWYAGFPRARWVTNHMKQATFDSLGFAGGSVEFPMSSEWTMAGDYDIRISDQSGVIHVRKSDFWMYRIGAKVQYCGGEPLRILDRRIIDRIPKYYVKPENDEAFWTDAYGLEPYHTRPKRLSNKRRIQIDGSIYYVPWTSGADPTNPSRLWNREDVLNALRHISKQRGTTVLSWSVAEQLALFYDGMVRSNYEDIARWWKDHFRAETKPYTYCRPFNLYVLIK